MFVLVCPRCGHHERTSEMECSACGEDLSSVSSTEVPDHASASSTHPSPDAEHQTQADDAGTGSGQAGCGATDHEEAFRETEHRSGGDATPPQSAADATPSSDADACQCRVKRPKNENGIVICKACRGIIRDAAPASDAGSRPEGPKESSPRSPHTAGNDAPRMAATLPWGEEVVFFERLMLGRAAHPDARFPCLSQAARQRLQKEHGTVSRFHMLLTADERGVTVEDLGAMNGSFVGGRAIPPHTSVRVEAPCEVGLGGSCLITVRPLDARR